MCVYLCMCMYICVYVCVCVHQWLVSVVGYIVKDLSSENESRVGHQRNELTILKAYCVLLAMV